MVKATLVEAKLVEAREVEAREVEPDTRVEAREVEPATRVLVEAREVEPGTRVRLLWRWHSLCRFSSTGSRCGCKCVGCQLWLQVCRVSALGVAAGV